MMLWYRKQGGKMKVRYHIKGHPVDHRDSQAWLEGAGFYRREDFPHSKQHFLIWVESTISYYIGNENVGLSITSVEG